MAQRYYLRAAGHKYNMGRGKDESPRQDKVERNWLPNVPHEMKWSKSRGINTRDSTTRSGFIINRYTQSQQIREPGNVKDVSEINSPTVS